MAITKLFDDPFFNAAATLPSSFSPAVIGIAGMPFLIDTSENSGYQQESFDVVQQRNTADARDVLLLPQDVWRQQAQSWHLGAGQSNMDRDNALPYRYESSFGVDPWTQWEISLLPATELLDAYSASSWLTQIAGYLVVVNDGNLYWYSSLTATPTVMTIAAGQSIIDIADYGMAATVLLANGEVWSVTGPAATPVKDKTHAGANMIAYEKDFLIMGDANKLRNITGTTDSVIYTHPVASFRWDSACAGNSCIYVLGGSGDKYVVHRVGINSDGTSLAPAIVAASLPDGEIGYKIESYLGRIFIGTDKGVRVAVADSNGDLTLGPIIPTSKPVRCFEGQDRFMWFGMSDMPAEYDTEPGLFPTTHVVGLGRMDLSVATTTALTPAYASDIAVPSLSSAAGREVRSVITYNGKRVFSIDGEGVYFESDTLMERGWLQQGIMSFSVGDTKTGLYTMIKTQPLIGEIDLDLSYDSSPFTRIAEIGIQGSVSSSNVSLNGAQFSRFNSRYVLQRGAVASPRLTRWELRAIPVKGRASRWTIPIVNHSVVDIDGVEYNRDPLVVKNSFVTLAEQGVLFTLQEAGQTYMVHVKKFAWIPQRLAPNGRSWEGIFVIVAEEVQ